nr:hypothetical protein [uncultured Carboxylicivirga sp.]
MKIYELRTDNHHSGDPDFDAWFIPFDGHESFGSNMMGINKFDCPDILYMIAQFELIPEYDYPNVETTAPIMSSKMLETIKECGDFKHYTHKVIMLDDSYLENQFNSNGLLKSDIKFYDNYCALQILCYTDAFDHEKSDYDESIIFAGEVGAIRKTVLKEPDGGYPPIFRIKESINKILITEDTKNRLENADIKGCIFNELE